MWSRLGYARKKKKSCLSSADVDGLRSIYGPADGCDAPVHCYPSRSLMGLSRVAVALLYGLCLSWTVIFFRRLIFDIQAERQERQIRPISKEILMMVSRPRGEKRRRGVKLDVVPVAGRNMHALQNSRGGVVSSSKQRRLSSSRDDIMRQSGRKVRVRPTMNSLQRP